MMLADEEMVDSVEMGRLIKKSPFTVRKLARNGDIPAHKLGGTWRFYPSEVREQNARPATWNQSPQSRGRKRVA